MVIFARGVGVGEGEGTGVGEGEGSGVGEGEGSGVGEGTGVVSPFSQEYSSLSGEPAPASVRTPEVETEKIRCATAAGLAVRLFSRNNAATPATIGEDIDVPLLNCVAESPLFAVDSTWWPGAKTSMQVPKFEYGVRASLTEMAPTVIALAKCPGE